MTINIGRSEVQAIGKEKVQLDIKINGTKLDQVENYLGGVISEIPTSENDIGRRVGPAMGATQKLNSIWKSKDIRNATKPELYRALVLSIITIQCRDMDPKENR